MIETINSWLPIVGTLGGGLLFIWRVTYNLNKSILLLNENIKNLNKATEETDKKVDNHEVRIVVLETVTGVKPINQKGDKA